MVCSGLQSIFPMQDLSVMGPMEILKQYGKLKKRLDETVSSIIDIEPDILITIDAPEFCFRVAKRIKKLRKNLPIVHYVAPTVWAWRPKRAKRISKYIDHILALLPFEPAYFHVEGLSCDFVGHPAVNEPLANNKIINQFKTEFSILNQPVILCLPGSRKSEVDRLMPIFGESLTKFARAFPGAKFILPSAPHVVENAKNLLNYMPNDLIFLDPVSFGAEKYLDYKKASFKIADLALAASGTVSLELAMNSTPMVIGYDMNFFSKKIISLLLRTDSVNLVNLISGNRSVPELIGDDCSSDLLFLEMIKVFSDNKKQFKDFKTTISRLGIDDVKPNIRAAISVKNFFTHFKTV